MHGCTACWDGMLRSHVRGLTLQLLQRFYSIFPPAAMGKENCQCRLLMLTDDNSVVVIVRLTLLQEM